MSCCFLHISDTHFGSSKDYLYRGVNPVERFKSLKQAVQELKYKPEFIIHTGDVCGDKEFHATAEHYKLAQQYLGQLNLPLYYLPGNHDETSIMAEVLPLPEHNRFDFGEDRLCYSFNRGDISFFVLDARIRAKTQGFLPQEQIDLLDDTLAKNSGEWVILSHYPFLPIAAPWFDQNMLVTNGADLHGVLTKYASRIRGVFYGHIHQPLQILRDGILYINAGSSYFQFSTTPEDHSCEFETEDANFGVVMIQPGETRVNYRPIKQIG